MIRAPAKVLSALLVLALAACSGHTTTGGDGGPGGDGAQSIGDGSGSGIDGANGGGDAGTSHHVDQCPGCPCFPGTNCSGSGSSTDAGTPPACMGAAANPTLIYPPDGVLLPPNTNVLEVQFRPGTGNQLYEIDFQNRVTDVRVITRCNPITSTRGIATGGCSFTLDMANWRYVADVNRGGDPVHVTVRATADGTCVAGSAARDISFATDDLQGGIYYWQSVTVGGVPGRAGGIYRYDFGREDIAPEPFIESSPTTGNRCVGCHFVSRDGERISFGSDDPDSDDEYGDLTSRLMDIGTRSILSSNVLPGFRAFNRDHTSMIASDGRATLRPPAMQRYHGDTGATWDRANTGTLRGTQPDWLPDDSKVVFVQPSQFLLNRGGMSTTSGDDTHFFGGSLFTMTYSANTFGTPTPLLMSTGENNYYPAYSPDGSFLVFNRVMGAAGVATDAFSNPNARIWAMPANGGAPVDLARLNQADGLSNSWPRWSPYVQHDRGHSIVWVTFSSTRDYGLRVQNQDPNGVPCYPPESAENANGSHSCPLVPSSCGCTTTGCTQFCVQPQIWMAAVEVDPSGGISAGRDTSHPAFWLPFQEVTAHNHIAQWVAHIPGGIIPGGTEDGGTDGSVRDAGSTDAAGMCGGGNAACGPGLPLCCSAYVCVNGSCGVP